MMDDQHDSQPFGRNTCHICGGTEFRWGYTIMTGGQGLYFYESDAPPKPVQNVLSFNKVEFKPVRARCCVRCNNIQSFAVDLIQHKKK
jgi:hypothetical protein